MNQSIIYISVLILMMSPFGSSKGMCHPHCECHQDVAACSNVLTVPTPLPITTTFLTLSNNFIGPILLKNEIDRLFYLPLRELYLKNNKIAAIEDSAFSSLSQLEVLDISNNRITELTANTFAELGNLTYLYANDAGIVNIASQAFSHVPNVIEIDLENNIIESIGREFTTLTEVSELLLAQNKISSITRDAFSSLNKLRHLSLFGNELNRPMSSWFREVVRNNGTLELDFRIRSTLRVPNPWLCCSEMTLYHNYVLSLDKSLASYPQLDVVCFWPVRLSGRIISTVTEEDLKKVPCADYTSTTVSTTLPENEDFNDNQIIKQPAGGNFLKNLNNAGLIFLIIFFIVLGCSVGLFAFWFKEKRGRKKLRNIASSFQRKSTENNSQDIEGSRIHSESRKDTQPPATRPVKPSRPAPTAPMAPPRQKQCYGAIQPKRNHQVTYKTNTDYSEDEIWSKST